MENVCCIFERISFIISHKSACSARGQWPAGTYGIARAESGCPSSDGFQWRTGWRFQDTEDAFPDNRKSPNFHLDASVDSNNLKRHFCTKTDTTTNSTQPPWPTGQYCIYKKGNCPKGLKSGYIHWDDEDFINKNKHGGSLPDGVYNKNTKIYYCCRTDGNKTTPVPLPTSNPFFLFAYGSAECQQVKWALASREWIRFDTEDTDNGDDQGVVHPYGAGMDDHTIHYCYYKSCNNTLNSTRGTFSSPNFPRMYPDGQYCSWRITVPTGYQVSLTFTYFNLQLGNSNDNVQVYDGKNETARSLGSFSGLSSPASPVLTSSNHMFVIFASDASGGGNGFEASYTSTLPTVLPTTKKLRTTGSPTPTSSLMTTGLPSTTRVYSTPETERTDNSITKSATKLKTGYNKSVNDDTAAKGTEGVFVKPSASTAEPRFEPTRRIMKPAGNNSRYSLGQTKKSEGSVSIIIIPFICLLIIGSVVLLVIIYLRMRRSHKNKFKDSSYVTFHSKSNSELTSLGNPLYECDDFVTKPLCPNSNMADTQPHSYSPVVIFQPVPVNRDCDNPPYDTTSIEDSQFNLIYDSTA